VTAVLVTRLCTLLADASFLAQNLWFSPVQFNTTVTTFFGAGLSNSQMYILICSISVLKFGLQTFNGAIEYECIEYSTGYSSNDEDGRGLNVSTRDVSWLCILIYIQTKEFSRLLKRYAVRGSQLRNPKEAKNSQARS
jgi:hypothetical protein